MVWFNAGKGRVFVWNFHSVWLVIIRLETASEAVYSPVALETAWAVEVLKAIEHAITLSLCSLAQIWAREPRKKKKEEEEAWHPTGKNNGHVFSHLPCQDVSDWLLQEQKSLLWHCFDLGNQAKKGHHNKTELWAHYYIQAILQKSAIWCP